MRGQKKHNPLAIVFGIALILFCLVIISTYMMSGLYARYRAADSALDDARVAGFSVDAEWGKDVTIDVTQTTDGTYDIKLSNDSEVAVRYGLVLTFDSLPDFLSVELNGVAGTVVGNTITFENVGELAPNAASALERTLTFSVGTDAFTCAATAESYTQEYTFTARVTCTQID